MAIVIKDLGNNKEIEWRTKKKRGGKGCSNDCADVRMSLYSGDKSHKGRMAIYFYNESWKLFNSDRLDYGTMLGRLYFKESDIGYLISDRERSTSRIMQITDRDLYDSVSKIFNKGIQLEYELKFDDEYKLYYIDIYSPI